MITLNTYLKTRALYRRNLIHINQKKKKKPLNVRKFYNFRLQLFVNDKYEVYFDGTS